MTTEDPMKTVLLVMVAGLISGVVMAVGVIAGPVASAGASGPPCTPKTPTIKGHPAMALCGPATATVTISGKTYPFHNGFCAEPIPHSDSFQLSLGTDVPTFGGPTNNAGQPFFSMDIAKGHTSASLATVYSGGHQLLANAAIALSGQIPTKGSFEGKNTATHFTGTWNCHGVLYKS